MAISIDPICKMKVEETNCKITSEYKARNISSARPVVKKLLIKIRKSTSKRKLRAAEADKQLKFKRIDSIVFLPFW